MKTLMSETYPEVFASLGEVYGHDKAGACNHTSVHNEPEAEAGL